MRFFLLVAWSFACLYAFACYGTMPKQCFTPKFAVTCQQIQISAIMDWRSLEWSVIQSIRVVGRDQ